MADKYKVERLISVMKGKASSLSGLCPVYEFLDGIIGNELVKVGEESFIPGFALIQYPLSEKDKQEIEDIEQGRGILKL
jgi:hypothetical protein